MNKRFHLRRSDWAFLIFGTLLTAVSLYGYARGFSFFKVDSNAVADPFQATYGNAVTSPSSATPTPSPSSTPYPTTTANLSSQQTISLLFPEAHAILTNTRQGKKGYPLKLRFEVTPKETHCSFVLQQEGQNVLTKDFKGSPTGLYQISILVRKPGHYVWQVMTETTQSEIREFTIKN